MQLQTSARGMGEIKAKFRQKQTTGRRRVNFYLHQGGYVFTFVCLSVCLYVSRLIQKLLVKFL